MLWIRDSDTFVKCKYTSQFVYDYNFDQNSVLPEEKKNKKDLREARNV